VPNGFEDLAGMLVKEVRRGISRESEDVGLKGFFQKKKL
jgi:hypothetical protein